MAECIVLTSSLFPWIVDKATFAQWNILQMQAMHPSLEEWICMRCHPKVFFHSRQNISNLHKTMQTCCTQNFPLICVLASINAIFEWLCHLITHLWILMRMPECFEWHSKGHAWSASPTVDILSDWLVAELEIFVTSSISSGDHWQFSTTAILMGVQLNGRNNEFWVMAGKFTNAHTKTTIDFKFIHSYDACGQFWHIWSHHPFIWHWHTNNNVRSRLFPNLTNHRTTLHSIRLTGARSMWKTHQSNQNKREERRIYTCRLGSVGGLGEIIIIMKTKKKQASVVKVVQ